MGTRPLRQYYDGVTVVVDDDLSVIVEPWLRHRRRLAAALGALTEAQWRTETRCAGWDARAVVGHLVTVDAFWVLSLRAAGARAEPTSYIRGFDPATGTDVMVANLLEQPTEWIMAKLLEGTDAFVATVEALDGDDWDALGEAPFGHLPARLNLAHAFWDSWLHERDILVPLGEAPAIEPDEMLVATWYSLVVGALQGGLLGDNEPVGPGPDAPIDVTLRFDDLGDGALHLRIDSGVSVAFGDDASTDAAGSAVALVEHLAGRGPSGPLDLVPANLAAQLGRAAQFL